jgi:hypothetical protein
LRQEMRKNRSKKEKRQAREEGRQVMLDRPPHFANSWWRRSNSSDSDAISSGNDTDGEGLRGRGMLSIATKSLT